MIEEKYYSEVLARSMKDAKDTPNALLKSKLINLCWAALEFCIEIKDIKNKGRKAVVYVLIGTFNNDCCGNNHFEDEIIGVYFTKEAAKKELDSIMSRKDDKYYGFDFRIDEYDVE